MERKEKQELLGLKIGRFHGLNILLPIGENSPERKGTGYKVVQLLIAQELENKRQELGARIGNADEAVRQVVESYHRSLVGDDTMFSRE